MMLVVVFSFADLPTLFTDNVFGIMGLFVYFQSSFGLESFVTSIACKIPLFGMDSHMSLQSSRIAEMSFTNITLEVTCVAFKVGS